MSKVKKATDIAKVKEKSFSYHQIFHALIRKRVAFPRQKVTANFFIKFQFLLLLAIIITIIILHVYIFTYFCTFQIWAHIFS